MLHLLIVEDNARLRPALVEGFESTGEVQVVHACDSGEAALATCLERPVDAALMDVRLAGIMNGIEAAVAIRRWDEDGNAFILNEKDQWVPWTS